MKAYRMFIVGSFFITVVMGIAAFTMAWNNSNKIDELAVLMQDNAASASSEVPIIEGLDLTAVKEYPESGPPQEIRTIEELEQAEQNTAYYPPQSNSRSLHVLITVGLTILGVGGLGGVLWLIWIFYQYWRSMPRSH